MDKFDRLNDLDRILGARRTAIPLRQLMLELECSESTVRRALRKLRDELNAPVRYDSSAGGWLYDRATASQRFPIPGPWLSAAELHALLSVHQILSQIEPSALAAELAPLIERIGGMLAKRGLDQTMLAERVCLIPIGARCVPPETFKAVTHALLQSQQVRVVYHSRSRDETRERTLSPQRLSWYRSNWYLDAWCHERAGLRRFAVDRLVAATPLGTAALAIADLDAYFADAYGIFAGPATKTATLRFSQDQARWVADEQWHPQQRGRSLPDGRYELVLPYGHPAELIMDILRYGPDVEVLAPDDLRAAVAQRLEQALAQYR